MVEYGLAVLPVSLKLGAASVSQALCPASQLLMYTQACLALSADLLIFDLWYFIHIYIANALWEHLLCHGYSAGYFFFNLGMQINGMQKSEQVPCRSQGSALDTCGCFMD